uniref:Uncharacterized protein n=1 Tax=Rhizophora mucronata TaxID=61149 RepID=A0A2P2QTK1_RHIMU
MPSQHTLATDKEKGDGFFAFLFHFGSKGFLLLTHPQKRSLGIHQKKRASQYMRLSPYGVWGRIKCMQSKICSLLITME